MTDILIPPPSDATNRLFSEPRILHREQMFVADLILEGWIFDGKTGKLYQPLFGLTAKTLDGKERTGVEGDIILYPDLIKQRFGVVAWDRKCNSFVVAIPDYNDEPQSLVTEQETMNDCTILGHVSDIANGVPCWECYDEFGPPEPNDGTKLPTKKQWNHAFHRNHNNCPACDGTGRRSVVVKGETSGD